jgi:plastocyanin
MERNLLRPGLVLSLALVAALSGCGGGGEAQTQATLPTPAFVAATPTPGAPPAVTPEPTPKPTPKPARATKTPAPRAPAAPALLITIQNFKFSPALLTVRAGQTIEVVNMDSAAHTITADDGSFDSGTLEKGQHYTFTIAKAGTYSYICDIHQYMTGTIKVT